jgi:hypothetical protein
LPRIQGHSPAGRCLGVLLVYGVRGSRGDVHDSPMIVLDGLLDGLLRRLKSTVDKTSLTGLLFTGTFAFFIVFASSLMQTQEPVVALLQPSGGLLLKLAASGECLVYLTRARLNRVMPPHCTI